MSRILNKETASNFESAEQSKQLIRTLSQSKCAKNVLFKQKFIPIDVSFLFLITIPFFPRNITFRSSDVVSGGLRMHAFNNYSKNLSLFHCTECVFMHQLDEMPLKVYLFQISRNDSMVSRFS